MAKSPVVKTLADQIAERLAKRATERKISAGVAANPAEAALKAATESAKKAAKDWAEFERDSEKARAAIARDARKEREEAEREAKKAIAAIEKEEAKKLADDVKSRAKERADREREEAKNLAEIAKKNRKDREKIESDGVKAIIDKKKKDSEEQAKLDSISKFSGIGKITEVVSSAVNGIVSFGNSLTQFVGKANPAAVQRFTLAVNDMQAVLGQILAPVLERVTILVRSLGDAFISLSPTAKTLISGVAAGSGLAIVIGGIVAAVGALVATFGAIPVIIGAVVAAFAGIAFTMSSGKQIANSFGRILKVFGTLLEIIAAVALPLINFQLKIVAGLFDLLGEALEQVGDVIKGVLVKIGLSDAADYDPKKGSSVGAAVRQASFSDVSSFANKAYASAYGGSQTDIPAKSLDELKGIRKGIDTLADKKEEGLVDRLKNAGGGYAAAAALGGPIAAGILAPMILMRKLFS